HVETELHAYPPADGFVAPIIGSMPSCDRQRLRSHSLVELLHCQPAMRSIGRAQARLWSVQREKHISRTAQHGETAGRYLAPRSRRATRSIDTRRRVMESPVLNLGMRLK